MTDHSGGESMNLQDPATREALYQRDMREYIEKQTAARLERERFGGVELKKSDSKGVDVSHRFIHSPSTPISQPSTPRAPTGISIADREARFHSIATSYMNDNAERAAALRRINNDSSTPTPAPSAPERNDETNDKSSFQKLPPINIPSTTLLNTNNRSTTQTISSSSSATAPSSSLSTDTEPIPKSPPLASSTPPIASSNAIDSLSSSLLSNPSADASLFTDLPIPPNESIYPTSPFVDAMLTDLYQVTMAYGYWKNDRHNDESVFDLFFRKHPFNGEFTIFAGLEEALRYVASFKFTSNDLMMLQQKFPDWDKEFWPWLGSIECSKVKIYSIPEGMIVIPHVPLMRVEGPLAICQLLETTLLVLVNYASLVATNAARHRLAVGPNKSLLEFGLRRAQGPDGAMSASRYSYIGGFDATSNLKAACMFGIDVRGTHAHSYVVSFCGLNELKDKTLVDASGVRRDFVDRVLHYRQALKRSGTHQGELAAFISYAQSYPRNFLALLDTYDSLESGVWNFIIVALSLYDFGYMARGIRLDSGDLAYLSKACRKIFVKISEQYKVPFRNLTIVASNDLSEKVLWSLREQGHEIDVFGVGTNLVTCLEQPALGCVYKLVQVNGMPRMKISQDSSKVTIPGKKETYRLFNAAGEPVLDLLISVGTPPPVPHKRILCRHPFDANKRCYVTPSRIAPMHQCVWDGKLTAPFPSLQEIRARVQEQVHQFREDHLRRLNPTPYKLSVTTDLYTFMHELWLAEMPIAEIL